jgi:small-conductance mechanosensitive channel
MQKLILALVLSVCVTGLLILLVRLLRRRLRVFSLLSFQLYVGALAAGLKVFSLFGVEEIKLLDEILSWVLIFLGIIVVLRVLGLLYFDIHLQSSKGLRLPPLLPQVAMWVAYLVTALITVKTLFPTAPLTGIFTASAITSLVLGLALQPILGNFFAGVVISLERPFRINDWINYAGTEARVVDITWRTTHLRTRDNDNLVVPNSKIADSDVINYYYPHPLHMERINVGVHYRTPPYRVKQAILYACSRVDGVLEKPSAEVFVLEFGDHAVIYETRIWVEDFAHKPRISSQVRGEIWEEFRRQGITIPFPIRTLEIEPRVNAVQVLSPQDRAETKEGEGPRAHLYVARGGSQGRALVLGGERIRIGRGEDCDLALAEPNASKEHCAVSFEDGSYVLTDLKSRYGTTINGERTDRKVLADLDRIEIGETVLVFETDVD